MRSWASPGDRRTSHRRSRRSGAVPGLRSVPAGLLRHVLVQELGRVGTGSCGHRSARLRVGCGRSLEESRGDRTRVYALAVTTPYSTLLDSTQARPGGLTQPTPAAVGRNPFTDRPCSHGTTISPQSDTDQPTICIPVSGQPGKRVYAQAWNVLPAACTNAVRHGWLTSSAVKPGRAGYKLPVLHDTGRPPARSSRGDAISPKPVSKQAAYGMSGPDLAVMGWGCSEEPRATAPSPMVGDGALGRLATAPSWSPIAATPASVRWTLPHVSRLSRSSAAASG